MTQTYASAGDVAGFGVLMLAAWGFGLLIALALGFGTAHIMGKKGYGKGIGFVLGFFGGIVGLIVALVLNEKAPPTAYPAYVQGYPARSHVAATQYPEQPFSPTDYYG